MKRNLLLSPDAAEGGTLLGTDAADLPAELLNNLVDGLAEGDPALAKNFLKLAGKEPSAVSRQPSAETPEQKSAREAAEAKALADKESGGQQTAATTEPEWTADQVAWFELREKATTEAEIAAADAQAPEFTDEQRTFLVKQGEITSKSEIKSEELSEEQKALVETHTKPIAEKLTKAEADLTAANAKATELTEKLAEALQTRAVQPVVPSTLPEVFTLNATQLDKQEQQYEQILDWCAKHRDGTAETPASGDQPAQPGYTAAQVEQLRVNVDRQVRKTIPVARQALANHMTANIDAETKYPQLKDPKSQESKDVETYLTMFPFLPAIMPSIKLFICDSIAGEKARLAKASKTSVIGKGFKLPVKPVVPLARPSPAPAPRNNATRKPLPPGNREFVKNGATDEALRDVIRGNLSSLPTVRGGEE